MHGCDFGHELGPSCLALMVAIAPDCVPEMWLADSCPGVLLAFSCGAFCGAWLGPGPSLAGTSLRIALGQIAASSC